MFIFIFRLLPGQEETTGTGRYSSHVADTATLARSFLHPYHNFRTTPPVFSPDNRPPHSSQGVLPNIFIGIVLMVHQPLKPPLRQTLEAYPGQTPAMSSTPPAIKS